MNKGEILPGAGPQEADSLEIWNKITINIFYIL
jgi:hypothetical protein